MKFDAVIWDWNGTLLNDVDVVIDAINLLLFDRDLKLLTPERYLEVFTFPIRDYYEQIGFDFSVEPFEIPANQFIAIYTEAVGNCALYGEVLTLLSRFRREGYRQFILSAMEQEQLEKTVNDRGITHFFDDLCGLGNHFAESKVANGKALLKERDLNPDRTVIIGDTIHDLEVAQALGCNCILVANGHQSKERLCATGAYVVDSLADIDFIN